MVKIEKATLHFQAPVLEELDLTIDRGETFGVLGQGGVGKSVLLKVMSQLLRLQRGTCRLSTERFTMTFQRSGLFDSMTVEENLYFVLEEARISKLERHDRVEASLEEVGLGKQNRLFPHELSGGMQKRLGIARALLLRPELIFYDDPTAGLDPVTSRTIIDLIEEMKKKYHMTIVLATSDLKMAFHLCSRLGFLYRGKMLVEGAPECLRRSEHPVVRQFFRGELEGPLSRELL